MTLSLTARDLDLIETLTCRVRLLTVGQAAELGWPNSVGRRTALQRLQQLAKSDWLELHIINAHPLLPVGKPVFTWQPDGPEPDVELVVAGVTSAMESAGSGHAGVCSFIAGRLPARQYRSWAATSRTSRPRPALGSRLCALPDESTAARRRMDG